MFLIVTGKKSLASSLKQSGPVYFSGWNLWPDSKGPSHTRWRYQKLGTVGGCQHVPTTWWWTTHVHRVGGLVHPSYKRTTCPHSSHWNHQGCNPTYDSWDEPPSTGCHGASQSQDYGNGYGESSAPSRILGCETPKLTIPWGVKQETSHLGMVYISIPAIKMGWNGLKWCKWHDVLPTCFTYMKSPFTPTKKPEQNPGNIWKWTGGSGFAPQVLLYSSAESSPSTAKTMASLNPSWSPQRTLDVRGLFECLFNSIQIWLVIWLPWILFSH